MIMRPQKDVDKGEDDNTELVCEKRENSENCEFYVNEKS